MSGSGDTRCKVPVGHPSGDVIPSWNMSLEHDEPAIERMTEELFTKR